MVAAGALGLACDSLPGGKGEEPAGVTAKAEAKGEAKDERPPAGGEGKVGAEGAGAQEGKVEPPKPSAPPEPVAVAPTLPEPVAVAPTPAEPVAVAPTPPEPSTPPEPGPAVAPAPPSPALPALAVVPPSDTAFSEKMQRRLRSTLREQHDARTQLASSLALPQPDGGVTVLALYEYSEFEVCVGKSDGSPEARKACANPTDDNERVLAGLRKCTGRGLVRARFGPPPKAQPTYGGELVVEATRPLTGGCTVKVVRGFSVGDVDGDGQPELAVDVVTKTPQTSFRAETPYDTFARTVGWYRADLTPQYESGAWEWITESLEEGVEGHARRIRLEDADGDGRADLILESVQFMNDGECDLDDTGWLKTAGTGPGSYDDTCAGKVETTTWRYDPGKDQWLEPASAAR